MLAQDAIDTEVLRLRVAKIKDIGIRKPTVYILKDLQFIGFNPKKKENRELKRYSYTKVVHIANTVLGKNVLEGTQSEIIQPYPNNNTTLLVVPSNWNRELPEELQPLRDQLSYIQFHVLLYPTMDDKELKEYIPHVMAERIFARQQAINRLSEDHLLVMLNVHAHSSHAGLKFTPSNYPDAFLDLDFEDHYKGKKSSKKTSKKTSKNVRSKKTKTKIGRAHV